MINTTIKYIVYTHSGGGVRHHHFGTQNNIVDEADGHASAGDTLNALGFPTLPFNGDDLPFAFMSVHGAADGNQLYTSPGNYPVSVGSDDIDILVVYAPVGGIGSGGGPGVWVDAFNVDTGNFSDDLHFITILTPPTPPDTVDAAKTTFANQEGEVSTVTAENFRASLHVDSSVPFVEWKRIIPMASITNVADVSLSQNESGEIWFAFYQSTSSSVHIGRVFDAMQAGIFVWTGDDTCGNGGHWIGPGHGPGPGPGPGAFKLNISRKTMNTLSARQQEQLKSYIKEYPAAAGAALTALDKTLTLLEKAEKILSGAKGRAGR